jgi:hypothetical protein
MAVLMTKSKVQNSNVKSISNDKIEKGSCVVSGDMCTFDIWSFGFHLNFAI